MLRKRICINIYKRQSFSNFLKKSVGLGRFAGSLSAVGVTFELVGNIPNILTEAEWKAEVEEDGVEEAEDALEEAFYEKYTQAVSAVETILYLERARQTEMLNECLAVKEETENMSARGTLRKATSAANLRMRRSTLGLSSLSGSTKNLSTSHQSLNIENKQRQKRPSLNAGDQAGRRLKKDAKRFSMPASSSSLVSVPVLNPLSNDISLKMSDAIKEE